MKCKVISVVSSEARRLYIPDEMSKIGVEWEYFMVEDRKAGDSRELSFSTSHLNAMKDSSGELMICEDDVVFLDVAKEIFDKALAQLPEDWDMLYLGGNVKRLARDYSENLFRISYGVHCTHAILYSEKARETVLKNYNPLTSHTQAYDHWLFCDGQGLMKCFICFPIIAYQRALYFESGSQYTDYFNEIRSNEIRHLI